MTATDASLASRRVLVTRPAGQGEALVAEIERRGGGAWHFPLLEICALEDGERVDACRRVLLELDSFDQVIFVSTNAVRFGVQWIEDLWPQIPVGMRWLGIGTGTCRAMREAGLPVAAQFDADHPMNSEALLAQPELQSLAGQKLLIVRGVGGREHLFKELTARGARVEIAECYRRRGPTGSAAALLDLIRDQHIGTICINSGESLYNLCALLGDNLHRILDLVLVVPGERVQLLAVGLGFQSVIRADNASDAAVIAALQRADADRHQ